MAQNVVAVLTWEWHYLSFHLTTHGLFLALGFSGKEWTASGIGTFLSPMWTKDFMCYLFPRVRDKCQSAYTWVITAPPPCKDPALLKSPVSPPSLCYTNPGWHSWSMWLRGYAPHLVINLSIVCCRSPPVKKSSGFVLQCRLHSAQLVIMGGLGEL